MASRRAWRRSFPAARADFRSSDWLSLSSRDASVFAPIGPYPGTSMAAPWRWPRSEEHTSELHSLMRISYAVFCLKKNKKNILIMTIDTQTTEDIHILYRN